MAKESLNEEDAPTAISSPITGQPIFSPEDKMVCPNCRQEISPRSTSCPICGVTLRLHPLERTVRLQDTILFFAILVLVALNISPVWPSDLIHDQAIGLLTRFGYQLPRTVLEATQYKQVLRNAIELYKVLNIFQVVILVSIIGFFLFNYFQVRGNGPRLSGNTWIFLGSLLLVFPFANLILSWQLFYSMGVSGTIFASLLIIFSGFLELSNKRFAR